MNHRVPQQKRLNPEPLKHCDAVNCRYPTCHCWDAEKITEEQANALLIENIEDMLTRLRSFIDDLRHMLSAPHYHSSAQIREYKKRKARLVKNFNYWKIKYDLIKHDKK